MEPGPAAAAAAGSVAAGATPHAREGFARRGRGPGRRSSSATAAKLRASLRRQIVPTGMRARISALLRPSGIGLRLTVPRAGRVVVSWYRAATSTKRRLLVARGALTFTRARTATIRIRPTAVGRRLLKHARRVRMTANGSFTPKHGSTVVATRTFVLKR